MSELSQAFSDLRSIQASLLGAISTELLNRASDRDPKMKAECGGSEEVKRDVLSVLRFDPTLGKGLEAFIQTRVADGYSHLTKETRWPHRRVSRSVDVTDPVSESLVDWLTEIKEVVQYKDPNFTWEKYQSMKHCSSSPEYINSQGEFTKTIWLEHNKEFARAREYAWAVGALHSLGPDYESYVQRLEGNIRRRLLGTLGRTEANEAMNTWIRKNSEKVIKTTWDLAKHTKDGLYRLDSALELLAESPSIKLTRMRNPQRLGRMGTKVETYHGRVDCWNMRNPGTNENVYSEWLGDRDISGQGNEESSED